MLSYYARRFCTVEVNYSFYRLPSASAVAAWRATGAWGLDIASGVEDAPGIKSVQKINELMAALRSLDKEQ